MGENRNDVGLLLWDIIEMIQLSKKLAINFLPVDKLVKSLALPSPRSSAADLKFSGSVQPPAAQANSIKRFSWSAYRLQSLPLFHLPGPGFPAM